MKKVFSLCIAIVFFSLMAFNNYPDKKTEEELRNVLFAYFDGIKNMDTVKMSHVTTADIIIYEEGKEYNNDSVFRDMRAISPYKVDFKFENIKIFADEKSGFMSYYENANFVVRQSTTFNLNFLGSAAFRKENGVWKLCLLHTTQRPKKKT